MNKACSRSKPRVKQDERNKKTRSSKGSDVKCDNVEVNSARILHQNNNSIVVKEYDCGDFPEQALCSQESFIDASQDTGCNREVRWDYRSPETVKKLKKCRGQYSSEEIRKIVDVFSDTDVKSEDSLLQSIKLYLPSQDEATFSRLSNQSKPRERVVKKYKQRALNKDSVQHMLTILKEQAEKPKPDTRKQLKRLSDGSTAQASEASDGYDVTNNLASEICNLSDLTSAHATETRDRSDATTSPVLSQSSVNRDDSFWSDEDLFKDNSFIIEATQNPEKFFAAAEEQRCLEKSEKTTKSAADRHLASLTVSQADEPVCHKTLLADSFVIPPSCTSKQSSVLVTKSVVNVPYSSSSFSSSKTTTSYTFKHFQTSGIPGKIPSCLSGKNCQAKSTINPSQSFKTHSTATSRVEDRNSCCPISTAASRSCNLNSTCGDKDIIQNSQSVIVNPAPEGKYKTSFRKFGSFNISRSPTASQNENGSSQRIGNSNMNSSFRKTLSFDSSVSSTRAAGHVDMAHKLSVPDFSNNVGKPKTFVSRYLRSEKQDLAKPKLSEGLPERVPSVPAVQEDGFDISLPEDVFQKFLEVDEILDSQASAISTASAINLLPVKTTSHCDKTSGISSETSSLSKLKLGTKTSNKALKPTFTSSTGSYGATNKAFKENNKSAAPKTDKQQLTTLKPTDTLLSPVRPVAGLQNKHKFNKNSPVHAYYKKTFSLQQKGSPHRGKSEQSQVSVPSSSTPVKGFPREGSDDPQASFLDSVFDDSFSNDHALFESQIVPFLEKVEAEAISTQSEPSILEPSILTKCSSEQIEQKRQAALQKRHLKLSQSK